MKGMLALPREGEMGDIRLLVCGLALLVLGGPAVAQDASVAAPSEVAASTAVTAAQPQTLHLAAGTPIEVEITDALSSRTNHVGDTFGLRLRTPIVVDGQEIVPAGAAGGGEVIDAVPSGFGGRQGRLIVSARYLEFNGQRMRIRGMQLMVTGRDRTDTALVVSMLAPLPSFFIQGGNIEIPAGTVASARLADDVTLPAIMDAPTPADPNAPDPTSTSGENHQ
jgi:outer membrane receptor protein involved in Fe transport